MASHALHSGGSNCPILRYRHNTLATNLTNCKAAEIDQNIFGIFGGGGRSGNFTSGRLGSSGRSGSSGNAGMTGIDGNEIESDIVGTFGKYKSGNSGRTIGTTLNLNSGTLMLNHALIL